MAAFEGTAWAILPAKLRAIAEFLAIKAAGGDISAEQVAAITAAAPKPIRSSGGTAVIPIFGVISQRMNMMSAMSGGTSTEQLSASIRSAVADESVKSIVYDIDSPGGSVDGITELAAEIFKASEQKPSTAVANPGMASAAYWLGSQAREIVVTPSGQAGSIGIIAVHQDESRAIDAAGITTTVLRAGKYKAEGNPYEPLNPDALEYAMETLNTYYGMFVADVARGRRVSESAVRAGFGQGRMLTAKDAVAAGVADRVGTLAEVLARHGGSSQARMAASEFDSEITASADAELEPADPARLARLWEVMTTTGRG